jgi:hypothetical protein
MNRQGFALESSLFLMLLIATLIAVTVTGVVPVVRTSSLDYRNARVSYAAEAGADAIMAQLEVALQDGVLSDADLAGVVPPTISGFTYDAMMVTRQGGIQVETITDGPFAGLYSLTQNIEINSRVSDYQSNRSAVVVTAKAQAIPLFQFGVFFEKDLEITNGPSMTFDGWVHSNSKIYMSSDNAWYRDVITTPNQVIHNRKDEDDSRNGVWIEDAFGVDNNLDFDSRTHPVPADFQLQSNNKFDNRLKTGAYGVDSLSLPLPSGMPARSIMEPRVLADVQAVRAAKFSWKADYYIEVDLGDNQHCNSPPGIGTEWIRDTQTLPNVTSCNDIFELEPDAFYEGREGRFADALTIDLAELFAWVGGDTSRESRILYITFKNLAGGDDPQFDGVYPVVRIKNGSLLANPITIATDYPIYIQGDYNTIGWQPAAVVGDAINWLSNAWTDAAHQTPGMTVASNTSYYTAVLAGHSATPWDWFDGGGDAPYGGGLENYPRFIEKWSGKTATFAGSLVSLSESQYALAPWSYGSYYTAPRRDWSFDTRFEDPTNLPPGTPVVGSVIHTAFRPVY